MIYPKNILLFCIASLLLHLTVAAQEMISPLHSNPAIKSYLKEHKNDAKNMSNARITIKSDTLDLPFIDDFAYDGIYPSNNFWGDSDVFINRDFPDNPPTIGVATFDGLDKYGNPYSQNPGDDSIADHLTSRYIRLDTILGDTLRADTSIWLSFFYQPQGKSYYALYPVDSLILEFEYPTDTLTSWHEVWSVPGSGDTAFKQVMINIRDKAYINSHFRFRFTNIANLGGAVDQWNIDYVRLGSGRNAADTALYGESAFLYRNHSILIPPYTSMPYSHYKTNPPGLTATSETVLYKNLTDTTLSFNHEFRVLREDGVTSVFSTGINGLNVPTYSTISNTKTFNYQFPSLPQSSLKYYTLNINESPHGLPQNDSVMEPQVFSNYYSYDDGTAEEAYGISTASDGAEGEVALRFDLQKQDTLTGVQFFWDQIPSNPNPHIEPLNIVVWSQITPGTSNENILYQIVDTFPTNDSAAGINGFHTYVFDTTLIVQGTIYLGWIQYEQPLLNVGFDVNTDAHNLLYFNVYDIWQQSTIPGTVMIRPVFGSGALNAGVNEIAYAGFSAVISPNPASNQLAVSGSQLAGKKVTIEIYNVLGERVYPGGLPPANCQLPTVINVSGLEAGLYMLKIIDDKSGQFVTNKVLVEH